MRRAKTVSTTMHYTVVLALVISVITTFLLGVVIIEGMFGPALDYIAVTGGNVSARRTFAAATNVQTRRVTRYRATFTGAVTRLSISSGNFADHGPDVTIGTPVRGTYDFYLEKSDSDTHPNVGRYQFDTSLGVKLGDEYKFESPLYEILVGNAPDYGIPQDMYNVTCYGWQGCEGLVSEGFPMDSIWFRLSDPDQSAFTSDSLPASINLEDFEYGTGVVVRGYSKTDLFRQWTVLASIDDLTFQEAGTALLP